MAWKEWRKQHNSHCRSHVILSQWKLRCQQNQRIYPTWVTIKEAKSESCPRFDSWLSHCGLTDRAFLSVNISAHTHQIWTWLSTSYGFSLPLTFSKCPALELSASLWDLIMRVCSLWLICASVSSFAWSYALPCHLASSNKGHRENRERELWWKWAFSFSSGAHRQYSFVINNHLLTG